MLQSCGRELSGSPMTPMLNKRAFLTDYLGIVPYEEALNMQKVLMRARIDGHIPDVLLLLQHPPVVTIGRFHGEEDMCVSIEQLRQEGIEVFRTNRGGSITYHGPGQLVGYPILDLSENHLGIREYVHQLEDVIIDSMHNLGVPSGRIQGYPGVWVNRWKICSIGIHVSHHVTMHGFALNVNTNLRHFSYINPCGDSSITMTSLSQLLGKDIPIEAVASGVMDSFSRIFGCPCQKGLNKCKIILDARNG